MIIDLAQWVDAESDPARRLVRQSMHAVMLATEEVGHYFPAMVMKGGVLLAVKYGSLRYTTDLDYSTTAQLVDIDTEFFLAHLNEKLQHVSERLAYDMICRVQGHKINPPRPDASFPTLQVTIGMARLTQAAQLRRLHAKNASHTVSVDYSFNEWPAETEILHGRQGERLSVYDLTDLIAEKYRSVLQQVVRNRARYQDVYDLNYLFSVCGELDAHIQQTILEKLVKSSKKNCRF